MDSNIPRNISAGDTLTWTDSHPDYLASDSWVLTYALVKDGSIIEITSSADGDDHTSTVAAAVTADYEAGTYRFQVYATKTTERHTVDSGVVEVLPNYAVESTGLDDRSHAKIMIDKIEALQVAGSDVVAFTIGERSTTFMSPAELIEWLSYYKTQYRKEEIAAGNIQRKTIKARFVGVS